MFPESDWENVRGAARATINLASSSLLRATLLFGFAMVALTLILVPVAEDQVRTITAQTGDFGIDRTTTGSIRGGRTYTIHRSILQANPDAFCIINQNGTISGDC